MKLRHLLIAASLAIAFVCAPAMPRHVPAIDKLRTMRRTPLAVAIALALSIYPRA